MKKKLSVIYAVITWFAVMAQYYLMVENRVVSIGEATIRFISYFTILTNALVAIYFTVEIFNLKNGFAAILNKPGILTALTVYITIVGFVYQVALRHLWQPTGLQRIVDELLHTLIPIMVIIYWFLYSDNSSATYKQISKWLIYPLIYLVFILIRGRFSNFYPYPFVDAGILGLSKVLINSGLLIGLFIVLSAIFISVGRAIQKHVRR